MTQSNSSQTKSTKLTKEAKERLKAERAAYYARKQKLLAFEETNYDKIVFLKGTGGFWSVIGHSAVILANRVGPAVKFRVPLKRDTDFRYRSQEGVVSARNLGFYKSLLQDSSLTKLEKEDEYTITFALKDKMTKDLYDLILHEQEIKRQQITNSILRSVPMPKTHMALVNALKLAYKLYREDSDTMCRDIFGKKMLETLRKSLGIFTLVCREDVKFETGVQEIRQLLNHASANLGIISEMGLWNTEKCMSLAGLLVDAASELEAECKMVEKMKSSGKLKK